MCVHFPSRLPALGLEIYASRFEKECAALQKDGTSYLSSMRGTLAILSTSAVRPPVYA